MGRIIAILFFSVLTYCAMLGDFGPWDMALGLVVAAVAVVVFRHHLLRGRAPSLIELSHRALYLPPLAACVVYDIIRGTIQVAIYSLRIRPLHHPGIVAVPLGDRTRLGAAMSGFFTTIAPGTFLVDYDWQDRVMLIHCIDASDPDRIRAEHQAFYRRFQRHVFP